MVVEGVEGVEFGGRKGEGVGWSCVGVVVRCGVEAVQLLHY